MFAGYKQVESFGPDAEYEDSVEVEYVTLDLGNNVHKELVPHTSEYRLAGLDTDSPMLQLDGIFFKGVHEQLIGTELLFTDGRDESNPSKKFVVPAGMTEQRIKFKQVEVREKGQEGEQGDKGAEHGGSSRGDRLKERGKGKGKGRGKETRKGKSKAREEIAGSGITQDGESILDLDTPLSTN